MIFFHNLLFKVEEEIENLSFEEKKKKRQEASKPILNAFWSWIEKKKDCSHAYNKWEPDQGFDLCSKSKERSSLCNIEWELTIRPPVRTDQPVVLIADPDFWWRCLQNCRLSTIRVQYGVVVTVILDVVIIGDFGDSFVITSRVASAWLHIFQKHTVLKKPVFEMI